MPGPRTYERINVYVARTVTAGESGADTYRIPRACTVESLAVRFYVGSNNELELLPELRGPDGTRVPLLAYAGMDPHISGDDDHFVFDVVLPAWRGWHLYVGYDNTAGVDLSFRVKVALDMENGAGRAVAVMANG